MGDIVNSYDRDSVSSISDIENSLELGLKCCEAKEYVKAFLYFERGAIKGNAESQKNLACLYYEGFGVKQDFAKAFTWMEKAAAQGDLQAKINMGKFYRLGICGHPEYSRAQECFEEAAKLGCFEGYFHIGDMYLAENNCIQARLWFEKAVLHGNTDAEYILGAMYIKGDGGSRKYDDGVALLQKAAARGEQLPQLLLASLPPVGSTRSKALLAAYDRDRKAAGEMSTPLISRKSENLDYDQKTKLCNCCILM